MQNVVLQSLGGCGGNLLCEGLLSFKCLCAFQGTDVYLPIGEAGCFWRNKIIVHQE